MKFKIKNRTFVVIIFIFFIIITIKIWVFDNPDILFVLAEGFDDPSLPYYMTIERIYERIEALFMPYG